MVKWKNFKSSLCLPEDFADIHSLRPIGLLTFCTFAGNTEATVHAQMRFLETACSVSHLLFKHGNVDSH